MIDLNALLTNELGKPNSMVKESSDSIPCDKKEVTLKKIARRNIKMYFFIKTKIKNKSSMRLFFFVVSKMSYILTFRKKITYYSFLLRLDW